MEGNEFKRWMEQSKLARKKLRADMAQMLYDSELLESLITGGRDGSKHSSEYLDAIKNEILIRARN